MGDTCTRQLTAPSDMTGEWLREQVLLCNDMGFLSLEILVNSSEHNTVLEHHGFKRSGAIQFNIEGCSNVFIKWRLQIQDAGDGILTQFAAPLQNKRRG